MDRADISFWLSIASFAIAVVLAVIKAFEFYGSRRLLFTADASFTGSPDFGNTIALLNKSSVQVTIAYYELAWIERRLIKGRPIPFTARQEHAESPVDPMQGCSITILPHNVHYLEFRGDDHFDWGHSLAQDIFLKILIVGRDKPTWLWITGPNKIWRLSLPAELRP